MERVKGGMLAWSSTPAVDSPAWLLGHEQEALGFCFYTCPSLGWKATHGSKRRKQAGFTISAPLTALVDYGDEAIKPMWHHCTLPW